MKFLNKHFIGLTTAVAGTLLAMMLFFGSDWNNIQKAAVILAALLAAHLWEENVFPGGFMDIAKENLGVTDEVKKLAGTVQFFLIIGFCLLGICFPQYPFLSMIIAVLGIGEALIHTAAIKLFALGKPYSPGMVTAYATFLVGAWSAWHATSHGYVGLKGWILAIVIMFVCFAVAQGSTIMSAGMSYPELFRNVRASVAEKRKNK